MIEPPPFRVLTGSPLPWEASLDSLPVLFREPVEEDDGQHHTSRITLQEVLSPLSLQEFLDQHLGRKHLLSRNETPGLFESFLSWAALNRMLREHRVELTRLRMVKDGKYIPTSSYIEEVPQLDPAGRPFRINAQALHSHLKEGATLIIDAIEEMVEPLRQLAESFERIFSTHVQANAYVVSGSSSGFDVHWDDHDTFVLHIAGVKDWMLYGPTDPHPVKRIAEPARPTDSAEPIWQGELHSGDLLYMPRGWWHAARGTGVPTIHVTFSVRHRNGADLLNWVSRRMLAEEIARRDVPMFAELTDNTEYMDSLQGEMIRRLQPGLVEAYEEFVNSRRQPRTNVSLPWALTGLDLDDPVIFRLAVPGRLLVLESPTGTPYFQCAGERFEFDLDILPVIRLLAARRFYSFAEVISETHVSASRLKAVVDPMLRLGLLETSEIAP